MFVQVSWFVITCNWKSTIIVARLTLVNLMNYRPTSNVSLQHTALLRAQVKGQTAFKTALSVCRFGLAERDQGTRMGAFRSLSDVHDSVVRRRCYLDARVRLLHSFGTENCRKYVVPSYQSKFLYSYCSLFCKFLSQRCQVQLISPPLIGDSTNSQTPLHTHCTLHALNLWQYLLLLIWSPTHY